MVLDKPYTSDGISSSCRLSGKQFKMPFLCKIELRWTNSSPLLSKWIGMIYFGVLFVWLSNFLYTFAKTISIMRSSRLFWTFLYCIFLAWRPKNFSSLFLELWSNFWPLLLWYLKKIVGKNWRKFNWITVKNTIKFQALRASCN